MGQIYACQFSTGVIKVGRSENAASRCASHKRAAAQFGVGVLDVHVLDCDNSTRAEVALISLCKKTATKPAAGKFALVLDQIPGLLRDRAMPTHPLVDLRRAAAHGSSEVCLRAKEA